MAGSSMRPRLGGAHGRDGDGQMQQRNVLGERAASRARWTRSPGYYRTGCCENRGDDPGMHVVCCRVTAEFLEFSAEAGNDLSRRCRSTGSRACGPATSGACARPAGPRRCEAGVACPVVLEATHLSALEFVDLDDLQAHAVPDRRASTVSGRARARQSRRVGRGDLGRRHAQRRLGDRVDERAHLVVVVQRVGRRPRTAAGAARPARPAAPGRGSPRSCSAMRRSWITGARPNSDARRRAIAVHAGQGVVDALAGLHQDLRSQPGGERQRVALVGSLEAEPGPAGWRPAMSAGPVGHPPVGHVVGRLVAAGRVERRDGRELRRGHRRP